MARIPRDVEVRCLLSSPWQFVRRIRTGGNARVDLVWNSDTGAYVAAKTMSLEELKEMEERLAQDLSFVHPHICQSWSIKKNNRLAQILLEYVPKKDLFDSRESLSLQEKIIVLRQLVGALIYCHRRGVVHCDLKPENVLMETIHPPLIKLCDFGHAFYECYEGTEPRGTYDFCSPEMFNLPQKVTYETDLWGLGTLAYDLIYRKPPFGNSEDVGVYEVRGRVMNVKLHFPKPQREKEWYGLAQNWISLLLVKEPGKRMGLIECLEHPFLTPWRGMAKEWIQHRALESKLC